MTSFFVLSTGTSGTGAPSRTRSTMFRVLGARIVSFWEVTFGLNASSARSTGSEVTLVDESGAELALSLCQSRGRGCTTGPPRGRALPCGFGTSFLAYRGGELCVLHQMNHYTKQKEKSTPSITRITTIHPTNTHNQILQQTHAHTHLSETASCQSCPRRSWTVLRAPPDRRTPPSR